MKIKSMLRLLAVTACFVGAASLAFGDPPAANQKLVTFRMFDDPSDPNSPVNFELVYLLEENSRVGSTIWWSPVELEITIMGSDGDPDRVWVDNSPVFDTSDGMWEVEHVDADNPVDDDFTSMPSIAGTASDPTTMGGDQLVYTLDRDENAQAPDYDHWLDKSLMGITWTWLYIVHCIDPPLPPPDDCGCGPTEVLPVDEPYEGP